MSGTVLGETAHALDPFHIINPEIKGNNKKSEQLTVNAVKQSDSNKERRTLMVRLKYADAESIADMLDSSDRFLSSQGSVSFDKRTNVLVLFDSSDVLQRVRQILDVIDSPSELIEIEARIAMVNEGATDELGVQWGLDSRHNDGSISGNLNDSLSISLPASSANASSIAFQLASLGTETLLDLELSALQSESKAEVISSPRLLTTNHQSAFIEQGTEIPYLQSNSDGEQTIAFKKAVLSLKVTPQVNDNGVMTLDLVVTQDRPGQVVKTGTGEAVAIITQRIGTQVLAQSGETIVLGGIYQNSVTHNVDKVPVLGDLPLMGGLFRRTYDSSGKSELLIFITPRLLIQ
nr:type IV pilus secretin PilQ [Vibrio viridaestus]